ncbi:hypothetical protein P0D88_35010 [Paraburkholderia sp. RL18-103-BIB-C]|uniref:hypothetical protein n=1 Tax=Paraburkholderia sp. RL18-103-BIB-C TaxID=3031637 RepID=UPI0038B895B2
MSGGGGQTQTTTNNIPQWVQDAGQSTYNNVAVPAANTPYTPYTGQQVAPINSTQQGAIDNVNANANAGSGALAQGVQNATNAGNYTPSTVGTTYDQSAVNAQLNPYTQSVIDTTNSDLQRQNQIANTNNDASATQQGAYGGTRNAVQDSLTNEAYARAMATNTAGLNQSNYTNAQSQALAQQQLQQSAQGANQNAGLTAAGLQNQSAATLGLLGSQQSGTAAQNYATQMNAGSVQQQQQQNLDNVGINQYQTAQNWPLRNLSILEGAINQTPYNTGSTTTQQGSTNGTASTLGGMASGAAVGSQIMPGWGTAIGAGVGGLMGYFGR